MTRARWIAVFLVGLIVLVGLAAFTSEKWLSNAAFGSLESDEATQYAMRVTISLDYEVQLLQGFGATNSVWTDAYQSVKTSDKAGFLDEFSPDTIKPVGDVDGAIGVGPDGSYRLGGLTEKGGSDFDPLPAQLTDKTVLRSLIDPAADAGIGRCGVVIAGTTPYLYCSFRVTDNSGGGAPVGNLIFLKALDAARLAALSKTVGMPLTIVPAAANGQTSQLDSKLGTVTVTSTTVSANRTSLDVTLPALGGKNVVLEFNRPRPIHAVATSWSNKTMAVLGALLVVIIGGVVYANRRSVTAKVRPLRETAEKIISSGDRSLRIGSTDTSEIGALGAAIDSMLDSIAEREAALATERAEREAEVRETAERERAHDAELAAKARGSVEAATEAIGAELEQIRVNASGVHESANSIENLVTSAAQLTQSVRGRSEAAGRAVVQLSESLQNVAGVVEVIAGVARQTNLLALNATIEAARAGEAGKGFGVVAGEVKELATATSSATADITATIEKLLADAQEMSQSIAEVQSGVAEIDGATGEVGQVTGGQRETAEMLNTSVDQAIDRLRTLADVR